MPFSDAFQDVYATIKVAVSTAIQGETIDCFRIDDHKAAGVITDDLLNAIGQASICIADLTGNNPNVMWEVGYAMALGKPTILITQDVRQLPFDLKVARAIEYRRRSLSKTLTLALQESVRQTLGKGLVSREKTPLRLPNGIGRIYGITGSMRADETRCLRRINALCSPLLSEHVTWLCGSVGVVDEVAVNYLAAANQRVCVVGYHAYDVSGRMLDLIRRHDLEFLDAQKEQIISIPGAPTERDTIFLAKADLLILLWNGQSPGTKSLINWYAGQKKDHIVGFI